jgi:hypothetical protein
MPDYCLTHALPWLPFPVIRFLEALDLAGKTVFEYGSGGSTLYWLKRGASCVSVEHDQAWYERVRSLTRHERRLDYRLVRGDVVDVLPVSADFADPLTYASADPDARGLCFRKYVSQIDAFPGSHFDLILIDGRARPSCLMHSIPKVRPQGIIILDNADRAYYLDRTAALLEGFELQTFFGHAPGAVAATATHVYRRIG